MVKFSKIMFFMLLCCLLPSVSNAKIEKVEKYQWTGYRGASGCTTTHGTCEEQKGYNDNGCPIWGKKAQDTGYGYRGCPYAVNTKDACDGLSSNLQEMSTDCPCPSGMIDITNVLAHSSEVLSSFNDLYQVTNDEVTYYEFGYDELNSGAWTKKKKYCINVENLKCKYGNYTLNEIKNTLGMEPSVSNQVADGTSNFGYNSYTFYNNEPELVLQAKGFNFGDYTCLMPVTKANFLPFCNGRKCDLESDLIYFDYTNRCKSNYREDGDITVKLWDETEQVIYYCKGCGPTGITDGEEIISGKSTDCAKEYNNNTQVGESYGFNNNWEKGYCTLCRNTCHTDLEVSGTNLYIKTIEAYDALIGMTTFTSGTGSYCPITCPVGTDVAFATTQTTAESDATGVTSADFDPCGEYSNNTVNAYLSYNINVASNDSNGSLVCANAVSCNRAVGYVEPCSSADPHWCSFWVSDDTVLPENHRSTTCGYACDDSGQTGVGSIDARGLYKSCECSTKGYTYQCNENGQNPSSTACTADPDTTALYAGCNCSAEYKYTCTGSGETGVGTPCTAQPSGTEYYQSCYTTPAVTEPEVGDTEIMNYCPIGDNIRETVLCHITALQNAAQSSDASITGYDGDKAEFRPVNQTIQLVPLVITSKEHYNSVYIMLEKFTDGQPALMYYDGENWIADESREYEESLKYAINPYVYSYKFIEQGIHWIKAVSDLGQFDEFNAIMNNTENLNSSDSVFNIVDKYSYIVNLYNNKLKDTTTTYLPPILGGKYPDKGLPAVEEGTYYYIPNLETSLENLQKALEKQDLKVDDLNPDDEETMFWYYLVNGYLQVEKQYYP